jgi:hypothetical protein
MQPSHICKLDYLRGLEEKFHNLLWPWSQCTMVFTNVQMNIVFITIVLGHEILANPQIPPQLPFPLHLHPKYTY